VSRLLNRVSLDDLKNGEDQTTLEAAGGTVEEVTGHVTGDSDTFSKSGPRRRAITFGVIAVLLVVFSLITFWGLTHSDWLYGTYGQITPAHWERIAGLRDELVHLGIVPEAVSALDDALLLPHPSTEDVLFDLRQAVLAIEPFASDTAMDRIQDQLNALIAEIDGRQGQGPTAWPTATPRSAPTPTPFTGAPVARH
jgi:hypothetical protein